MEGYSHSSSAGNNGTLNTGQRAEHSIEFGRVVMKNLVVRFAKCESGATAIEYGLIAALIGVAIITAVSATGNAITNTFNSVKDNLQ
jgi:pilus assembly protein Flp/PilA